ncbi:MAG TPA: hypothetical protein PLG73_03405 [Candidatus Sumerlaeota bacterium]|nr:hypothetical protein [Candidatus Sumerlaeota bacterium]
MFFMMHDARFNCPASLRFVIGLGLITVLPALLRAEETLPLIANGEPSARIVLLDPPSVCLDLAAGVITKTVERWSGGTVLPRERPTEAAAAPAPAGETTILLTTLTALRETYPELIQAHPALLRANFTDPHGFSLAAVDLPDGRRAMAVVSSTERGVLNGAHYLRDFLIDGSAGDLSLKTPSVVRSPQMLVRGTYCLAIYGVMPQYTVEDWRKVFEGFARDGMERVYFWVSGMFPSEKFPQTFDRDASQGTVIRETGQIREIIQAAHDVGLKLYLGSGVFAWSTVAYLGEGLEDAAAVGVGGLCPENAEIRQRHMEYFLEMADALPEADGFFFELRDEHGECQCDECQVPVDSHGSKMYGEYLISFVQQFTEQLWRKHPTFGLCVNVGYDEHKDDPNFYAQITRMNDPRFEWLDCRWSWTFPTTLGERVPGVYISRRMIHWGPFYSRPLREMVEMTSKAAREGYIGYLPAYEPGYSTADFYSHEIPYPMDRLPYLLTGFVYRELTWEPIFAGEELQQRIHDRFFGQEAPLELADDLQDLRDWVVANAAAINRFSQDWINYSAVRVPYPNLGEEVAKVEQMEPEYYEGQATPLLKQVKTLLQIRDEGLKRLAEIEANVEANRSDATPKTLETLDQMQRLIDDSRASYDRAVPEPAALDDYLARLEALLQQ